MQFFRRTNDVSSRPTSGDRPLLAVVDLETTGMWAEGTDRIVEIAILHLDSEFNVTDEYTTLVNPDRDLGPTWLHGITGRHVRDAPPFTEVADDIVRWMSGRVMVAYNASFESRFLRAEFLRHGWHLPTLSSLDPMSICGGALSDACARFGVPIEDAHTALGDARATADLVKALDRRGVIDCHAIPAAVPRESWPEIEGEHTEWRRADAPADADVFAHIPLQPGMAVCFTGDTALRLGSTAFSRVMAEETARSAGFVVKSGVSKKLNLLVATDPDSLSGKARKARELGVPIMPEVSFWQALGYEVHL